MCYSNPGLIRQVVQDARDYFDGKGAKPGAVAVGDYFAVVAMDNGDYCKCPTCAAAIGVENPVTRGKGMNYQATRGKGMFASDRVSNYFFSFINEVAKEVKRSHPQKHIATLAYDSYAYPPTEVKLESNVWIEVCIQSRNLFSRSTMRNEQAVLDAWVAESKRPKLLWLYYCYPALIAANNNFRCFPGFFRPYHRKPNADVSQGRHSRHFVRTIRPCLQSIQPSVGSIGVLCDLEVGR